MLKLPGLLHGSKYFEYDEKVNTLYSNTFKTEIFNCVNVFFSESEDFLLLLRPLHRQFVHSIGKFFRYKNL